MTKNTKEQLQSRRTRSQRAVTVGAKTRSPTPRGLMKQKDLPRATGDARSNLHTCLSLSRSLFVLLEPCSGLSLGETPTSSMSSTERKCVDTVAIQAYVNTWGQSTIPIKHYGVSFMAVNSAKRATLLHADAP